jgi:hypothetical protein
MQGEAARKRSLLRHVVKRNRTAAETATGAVESCPRRLRGVSCILWPPTRPFHFAPADAGGCLWASPSARRKNKMRTFAA